MERQIDNLVELMNNADVVRIGSSSLADIIQAITGSQSTTIGDAEALPKIDYHYPPSVADIDSLETCSVAQSKEGCPTSERSFISKLSTFMLILALS